MMSRFWLAGTASARRGDPCAPALPGPFVNVALAQDVVTVPPLAGGTTVNLIPFSFGSTSALQWKLYTTKNYQVTPSEGTSAPGEIVSVRVTRSTTAGKAAEALQVWVADPSKPDAPIPVAEWFGGLAAGP
jgi:hypothetical protein